MTRLTPIYSNFLIFDISTLSLKPDPQLFYQLPFGFAVAIFLLISAVAHFSLASFSGRWYVRNLKKEMNPGRINEYALSSSLMIVLIGMLMGIWDLGAIILIFSVNASEKFTILLKKPIQQEISVILKAWFRFLAS